MSRTLQESDEIDAEVARIVAMTGDELRAEIIAEGGDPDEMIRRADAILIDVLATLPTGGTDGD